MKETTNLNKFLVGSFVVLAIVTLGVFLFLAHYMDRSSTDTIAQVGESYMHGMNEQITLHFQTTVSLRLDQARQPGKW